MSRFAFRKASNYFWISLSLICVVLAIIPLGAMLIYVMEKGLSSINIDFFTKLPKPTGETGGGMANAITGTLEIILLASLIGIPIGILSGIYLSRTTNLRFAYAVRFVTDVIAGTPSIIAGVVAYAVLVVTYGFSAISGGVALGLLMFPTVTRATEEAIRLVPPSVREAGLALGIPEWKVMMRILLPAAINGIITAIMLGIARVAGETAPVLFTAFGSPTLAGSPMKPVETLPQQIWYYATSPYSDWQAQAWAGAFVLFALVVILNIAARILTRRSVSRQGMG